MPVAKTNPRRTVLVSLTALVFALGLLAIILVANGTQTNSGTEQYDTLSIQTLLKFQDRDGVPTCLNDPATGNRPICIFHTGDEDTAGWVAYDAQIDGCAFETLTADSTEFVDSCTGETYPFTGDGIPAYQVTTDDGRLEIDLGGDDPVEETTSSTSTSTTVETPTTQP